MDHNTDKFSVRCDERVDLFRELLKILFFEWARGSDEEEYSGLAAIQI